MYKTNRFTDMENKTCGYQRGEGGGEQQIRSMGLTEITIHKINNKDLLYSTAKVCPISCNSLQWNIICEKQNQNQKKSHHYALHLKLTKYCKSTIFQ